MIGRWDPLRIEQVVSNLVGNALKYGEGNPIDVSVEGDARSARLVVRDHGIGIEPEQLPDLFRDFRQGDGSETRSYGGLGLGLAYVKRIASVHGGDVLVESKPGKGSSFSLVLPAATTARISDVTKRARKAR